MKKVSSILIFVLALALLGACAPQTQKVLQQTQKVCNISADILNSIHGPARLACALGAVPHDRCEEIGKAYNDACRVTEGVCHALGHEVRAPGWED